MSQTVNNGIVGAVYQNDMDKTHANEERYDAPQHDFVLQEQSFCANPSSKQSDENDGDREDCAPP
jgi:hypothetical protein